MGNSNISNIIDSLINEDMMSVKKQVKNSGVKVDCVPYVKKILNDDKLIKKISSALSIVLQGYTSELASNFPKADFKVSKGRKVNAVGVNITRFKIEFSEDIADQIEQYYGDYVDDIARRIGDEHKNVFHKVEYANLSMLMQITTDTEDGFNSFIGVSHSYRGFTEIVIELQVPNIIDNPLYDKKSGSICLKDNSSVKLKGNKLQVYAQTDNYGSNGGYTTDVTIYKGKIKDVNACWNYICSNADNLWLSKHIYDACKKYGLNIDSSYELGYS